MDWNIGYRASATHLANDEQIGAGKPAVVVVRLSDHGVIRQFQLISEDVVSTKLKIIEDIALASEWLFADAEI